MRQNRYGSRRLHHRDGESRTAGNRGHADWLWRNAHRRYAGGRTVAEDLLGRYRDAESGVGVTHFGMESIIIISWRVGLTRSGIGVWSQACDRSRSRRGRLDDRERTPQRLSFGPRGGFWGAGHTASLLVVGVVVLVFRVSHSRASHQVAGVLGGVDDYRAWRTGDCGALLRKRAMFTCINTLTTAWRTCTFIFTKRQPGTVTVRITRQLTLMQFPPLVSSRCWSEQCTASPDRER